MRVGYFDDPQDVAPTFRCGKCNGELYDYDNCFLYGSTILCEDCADECDDEYEWMAPTYALQDYYCRIYGGKKY